jgi:hypothetical protein
MANGGIGGLRDGDQGFAGDYKKVRTLLRIAGAIIVAYDFVTPAEVTEFDRLCYLLSIEPGTILAGLGSGPT